MPTINKGKWGKFHVKENKSLFFYPQEWLKILDRAKPKQLINLQMQINTGARINEAKNIEVRDIDLERRNLILRVTKVRSRKKETKPTPRIIPISSKFAKFLKKQTRDMKLGEGNTFPMLSVAAYNTAIKKLAKDIGRKDYQDFSSHNIRKTFENWLIALGVDGFAVAKHLGHDAKTALTSYISPDIFRYEDKVLIRQILGDLYSYNERRF